MQKSSYYMATLNREADLLQQIIEDLLLLSRLDQGRTQPYLTSVDVNDLLSTLANDRATLFAGRGLTLIAEPTPGPLIVMADARMLTQVATNLMTNAMNYTRPGGTVTVRTAKQLAGDETWVTFAISDTGPGITPEDRTHLFERFYRGEAGRQSKAPGTGLGLAICRELVELHRGKITMESEVGRGSRFVVWLPAG
jgi:signal transduction histidine kinase